MKQGSVGMLPQRRPLAIMISLLFAGAMGAAYAADVQINTPPGGNFVVKDNAGATTLLKVDGSGPVTVPNLPGAPTYTTGVCFDSQRRVGQVRVDRRTDWSYRSRGCTVPPVRLVPRVHGCNRLYWSHRVQSELADLRVQSGHRSHGCNRRHRSHGCDRGLPDPRVQSATSVPRVQPAVSVPRVRSATSVPRVQSATSVRRVQPAPPVLRG